VHFHIELRSGLCILEFLASEVTKFRLHQDNEDTHDHVRHPCRGLVVGVFVAFFPLFSIKTGLNQSFGVLCDFINNHC